MGPMTRRTDLAHPIKPSRRQLLTGLTLTPIVTAVRSATTSAQSLHRTFVLVHGAWHGGWCWKKVKALLTTAGHRVYTPTLTGLGERSHLLTPEVDLDTHINDIAALFHYEDIHKAILVGHSYGGMVVAGVAASLVARLAGVIYLDAFLPDDGKALQDYVPLGAPEGAWRLPPPGQATSIRCQGSCRRRVDGSAAQRSAVESHDTAGAHRRGHLHAPVTHIHSLYEGRPICRGRRAGQTAGVQVPRIAFRRT
jgi:pimeloyl-ACP methyl ester carboxylesterase